MHNHPCYDYFTLLILYAEGKKKWDKTYNVSFDILLACSKRSFGKTEHNGLKCLFSGGVNWLRCTWPDPFTPPRLQRCLLWSFILQTERHEQTQHGILWNYLFTISAGFLFSTCSFIKVIWSAVSPSSSTAFTLAPWSNNIPAMTECPLLAAKWSAEWLWEVRASTSHPGCLIKNILLLSSYLYRQEFRFIIQKLL